MQIILRILIEGIFPGESGRENSVNDGKMFSTKYLVLNKMG